MDANFLAAIFKNTYQKISVAKIGDAEPRYLPRIGQKG